MALELFNAYRKNDRTKTPMKELLSRLFERSKSYAAATTNIKYLEELDDWEPTYQGRILAALKENDQISGANGVKARVEALGSKWDPFPL